MLITDKVNLEVARDGTVISPVRFEEKIFVGVPVSTMNTNFNTVPQFYFNLILHVISVFVFRSDYSHRTIREVDFMFS